MSHNHPEAFGPQIAAQRRSDFELAAQHARMVRTLKCARRAGRRAAAEARAATSSPPRAPRACCTADIG